MNMNSTNEPNPPVPILRKIAERGRQHLAMPSVSRGALQFFVGPVRAQLEKIYGRNSNYLDLFPLIPVSFPDDQIKKELARRVGLLERFLVKIEQAPTSALTDSHRDRIFIGHGHSPLWRELKDFLVDRLGLQWDEFNRTPVAGISTVERLQTMLDRAVFAFLILTADEERVDGSMHARSNVIQELGLFQGVLGLRRSIVLIEDGCTGLSNIFGLTVIQFPRGAIADRFEEVRRVLEREEIIT